MKASREELLVAIKVHVTLNKTRERLRKMYPPGTCNAEDAWRDFGRSVESSEANLKRLAKQKLPKAKVEPPTKRDKAAIRRANAQAGVGEFFRVGGPNDYAYGM